MCCRDMCCQVRHAFCKAYGRIQGVGLGQVCLTCTGGAMRIRQRERAGGLPARAGRPLSPRWSRAVALLSHATRTQTRRDRFGHRCHWQRDWQKGSGRGAAICIHTDRSSLMPRLYPRARRAPQCGARNKSVLFAKCAILWGPHCEAGISLQLSRTNSASSFSIY